MIGLYGHQNPRTGSIEQLGFYTLDLECVETNPPDDADEIEFSIEPTDLSNFQPNNNEDD